LTGETLFPVDDDDYRGIFDPMSPVIIVIFIAIIVVILAIIVCVYIIER
jgi:hypothetical protein